MYVVSSRVQMTKDITLFGRPTDGKFSEEDALRKAFLEFDNEHIEVTVSKKIILLTQAQRGDYFGYICDAVLEKMREKVQLYDIPEWLKQLVMSQTKDSIHKFLKDIGIKDIVDEETGEIQQGGKSLRGVSKGDMPDFVETVAKFCAEHLVLVLLPPNTQRDFE